MSGKLVITIPGTPDAKLSPNARCHWRAKQKPKCELARSAFYATTEAIARSKSTGTGFVDSDGIVGRENGILEIGTTIAWEKGRKSMDADNALASLKAAFDGVAQALGVDDRCFRYKPVQQIRDAERRGFVEIAVEEAAA